MRTIKVLQILAIYVCFNMNKICSDEPSGATFRYNWLTAHEGISCLGFTKQLTLFDCILQCNFKRALFVIRTKILYPPTSLCYTSCIVCIVAWVYVSHAHTYAYTHIYTLTHTRVCTCVCVRQMSHTLSMQSSNARPM